MPQNKLRAHRDEKFFVVKIQRRVHHEIKLASAYRHEGMFSLIARAWEAFKKAEGKRLHDRVPDDTDRKSTAA